MFFSPECEALYDKLKKRIERELDASDRATVAIDGCCTSGKSTLADKLMSDFPDAAIFHIDDFFLRDEQMSENRLATPGGNIDYERFIDEVLSKLSLDKPFFYSSYNWQTRKLEAPIEARAAKLNIVEGVYTLHEKMRKFYDITVFVKTDRNSQIDRLIARNGEGMIEIFKNRWIPLEELYFNGMSPEAAADFVFYT